MQRYEAKLAALAIAHMHPIRPGINVADLKLQSLTQTQPQTLVSRHT